MTPTLEKPWYILHVYSGFEQRVEKQLRDRFESSGCLGAILIATEDVVEIRQGRRIQITRNLYPGYLLAQFDMSDSLWHAIRSIPRVSGFVGGSKPTPLSADEVNQILFRQSSEFRARPKVVVHFEKGDTVRIIEGPFVNFSGQVDEVNQERTTLRALVIIFGRPTPIELDFLQVEKI